MVEKENEKKMLPKFHQELFPSGVAIFLDIDGTLLEITSKPGLVKVNYNLKKLILKIMESLDGAVAFISGRTILEIDQLFKPLKLPASGKHGAERRDASGRTHIAESYDSLIMADIIKILQKFVCSNPGTILENKTQTVALHYRLKPQIEKEASDLINALILNHEELELLKGKMVFEIKPKATNKGTAITQFMNEQPFAGKTPFFFGDDVSDEDGFQAINLINGISTCINPQPTSIAQFRLETVPSVIDWLENLSNELREQTDG